MDKSRQRQLVLASARGDKTAYAELIRQYYGAVYGQCLAIVSHPQDAEDIAQDVLLKGYIKIGQLRDPDQFGPWIRKIAQNNARTFLGGRKQELEFNEQISEPTLSHDTSQDDCEQLQWAIGKLPAELRTPLVLYYFHGKTLRAVAEQLGASLTDIHRKVRCALAQLYQLMKEQGDKV